MNMEDTKLYRTEGETTPFDNETKGHARKLVWKNGETHVAFFACTVGELRKYLELHADDDLIEFTGCDTTSGDYAPYTDDRGISITRLREATPAEIEEVEKNRIAKIQATENAARLAAEKQESKEREEYLRLQKKFGN